jgi:hypothetical protein
MKLDIEKEKLATEISKVFPEWRGRNFSIWREGKERSFFVYFGKAFDKDTTKYYEVMRMHPVGHPKRIEELKKLGAWLAKAEELEAMK